MIEKRLKENRKYAVPVCLAGARHRPPEDVGGKLYAWDRLGDLVSMLDDGMSVTIRVGQAKRNRR